MTAFPALAESESPRPFRRLRSPAVPAAVAFGLGILLDRLTAWDWAVWLFLGLVTWLLWAISHAAGWRRTAPALVLLLVLLLGAARHHLFWSVRPEDELALLVVDGPQLVEVTGVLIDSPRIRQAEPIPLRSVVPESDRTQCRLRCETLKWNGAPRPVSGQVQLMVTGHLLHAGVGDRVTVRGRLARPMPPQSPGQFDYGEFLRRQGSLCLLNAADPDAVTRWPDDRQPGGWHLARSLAWLRHQIDARMNRQIDRELIPEAAALLVGNRAHMTDEITGWYMDSGTIHLLAVSGVHVAILAAVIWLLCRVADVSRGKTTLLLGGVIVGYALLTEGQPSVARATVLILVVILGWYRFRLAPPENSLGLSALLILIWNPTDLFQPGAQLSFLSVMAIFWVNSFPPAVKEPTLADKLAALREPSRLERLIRWCGRWLRENARIAGAVAVFTVPLVASQFHLVSPVGFVVTILLLPLTAVTLWVGYIWLVWSLLIPWGGGFWATLLNLGLGGLHEVVRWSAWLPGGHQNVPAPAGWWLAGYYLVLAGWYAWQRFRGWRFLWLGWVVVGLTAGLLPDRETELRCTFIAVGHGCSVLVECPDGETLLYDCGAIDDSLRARRMVQGVLRERGVTRLDALVISHADLDHFNAVPPLVERLPVASVLVSPQMAAKDSAATDYLWDSLIAEQIPLQFLKRGEQVQLSDEVTIRVLHPPPDITFPEDNENSLVLLLEYAGRKILLTGDLERGGMGEFLKTSPPEVDVSLSPHHGSPEANPVIFAQTVRPETLIISGGDPERVPALEPVYGRRTTIYSTTMQGSITVTVSPAGELRVTPFLSTPLTDSP